MSVIGLVFLVRVLLIYKFEFFKIRVWFKFLEDGFLYNECFL